jgi:hypothetical protein
LVGPVVNIGDSPTIGEQRLQAQRQHEQHEQRWRQQQQQQQQRMRRQQQNVSFNFFFFFFLFLSLDDIIIIFYVHLTQIFDVHICYFWLFSQQPSSFRESFSSLFRTPGALQTPSFPWSDIWKLFPLVALPMAVNTLISTNLPSMLLIFFAKYENCDVRYPHANQSSVRFTCANDAGTSYKATFDTASALLSFFATPVVGALSDEYGRKPILA